MSFGSQEMRPKSRVLLLMLEVHKFSSHLDEHTRTLIEWAAEDMRARDEREAELKSRLVRQASHLERAEARR
jgi:hypothetical protein